MEGSVGGAQLKRARRRSHDHVVSSLRLPAVLRCVGVGFLLRFHVGPPRHCLTDGGEFFPSLGLGFGEEKSLLINFNLSCPVAVSYTDVANHSYFLPFLQFLEWF
jgi:hypothetical protein